MYNPSGVSTMTIRELYLEQRWRPIEIARYLGCSRDVVNHRLRHIQALSDPRAALPFRRAFVSRPGPDYTLRVLLREYVGRDGRSQLTIGKESGINGSYLNHLLKGRRASMGADLCGRLAATLSLSVLETDRLYVAAGHTPPTLLRLGGWTDTLARICAALLEEEG